MKKSLYYMAFLAVLAFPFVSHASFDTNLKYGAKGQSVLELQDFLSEQGYLTVKANGYFGFATLKAVKAFQTAESISPVSGFFGALSRAKASDIVAKDLSDSDSAEQTETGNVASPITEPKSVSDTETQSKLDGLTKQVTNLSQQLQDQTRLQQQIVSNTTPIPVVESAPIPQPVKEIRFDNLPTEFDIWNGIPPLFTVPTPSFFIDNVRQNQNYPIQTTMDNLPFSSDTIISAGKHTFTVTSTGYTPKSFDVIFVNKTVSDPTISAKMQDNIPVLTITSTSGPIMIDQVKMHLISSTYNSINFGIFGDNAVSAAIGDNFAITITSGNNYHYIFDGKTVNSPIYYGNIGKGSFQLEIDSIKYASLPLNQLKTIDVNFITPVITIN